MMIILQGHVLSSLLHHGHQHDSLPILLREFRRRLMSISDQSSAFLCELQAIASSSVALMGPLQPPSLPIYMHRIEISFKLISPSDYIWVCCSYTNSHSEAIHCILLMAS